MSLIKKFSLSYSIDQAKKKKQDFFSTAIKPVIYNIDNGSKKEILTEEVIEHLLSYGYNISQVMCAYKISKFATLDEAIFFLMRDPETKKFNHRFYSNEIKSENVQGSFGFKIAKESLCYLCNEKIEDHMDNYLLNQSEENNKINLNEEIKETSLNLDGSNVIFNNSEKSLFEKRQKVNKIKHIEIPKDALDLFDNPDVCTICFDEVLEEANSFKFTCGHRFCKKCINQHLNVNINNGKVVLIKCLYGGCPKTFLDDEVKLFVLQETFVKYKKYKIAQLRLANNTTNYINCPYPDCENLIESPEDVNNSMVQCESGHKFCTICKTIGWHEIGKCKKNENSILNRLQRDKNGINFKQCPKCSIIIEKIDGCNQMRCTNCDFEFCWLCMRSYSDDHYALYNFIGCPGLRFKSPEQDSCLNYKIVKCLWLLCSIVLGILAFIGVILFYCFFGCAYEFVRCYTKESEEDENEDIGWVVRNEMRDPENNQIIEEEVKNTTMRNWIIALLIFLGMCCQPLYVLFYVVYAFMEFSKRFGCWFYYGGMS